MHNYAYVSTNVVMQSYRIIPYIIVYYRIFTLMTHEFCFAVNIQLYTFFVFSITQQPTQWIHAPHLAVSGTWSRTSKRQV